MSGGGSSSSSRASSKHSDARNRKRGNEHHDPEVQDHMQDIEKHIDADPERIRF